MIYIFDGCCAVCKAPCICCRELRKAFEECCKGCGGGCSKALKSVSDCWAPVVQNPMGSYVIGTWLTMALAVACCAATIPDAARADCRELVMQCLANIAISFVHAAFAFYIQRRLVSALRQAGKESMTHQEISQEAKSLAKYDIGFCLYFFFFVAAFGYNVYAIGSGRCSARGYQMGAIGLLLCYGVGAWHFALCWFCGQCCFGKAEKRGVVKTMPPATEPGEAPSAV